MLETTQEELKPTTDAPKVEEELKQTTDAPKVEEQIDYKAELEKIKKERDQYKEGLLIAKKKLKGSDYEDVDSIVEEKLNSFKNELISNNVKSIVNSITSDENEKALIMEHYNSSINKTGTSLDAIKNDLENAKLIANKSKLFKENTFLKEALVAKSAYSSNGVGSNTDRVTIAEEVKLSPVEQTMFERANKRRLSVGRKPLTANDFVSGNIN